MFKKLITNSNNVYRFCFFDQQISDKYGKKCCRYGQDGKPMPEAQATEIYKGLQTFLNGWKLREQGTRLKKYYYAQSYPNALQFLIQVCTIDMNQFKQCPSYHMTSGQILCLQVFSPSLKGLSMIDFQLAMRINNIPFKKYNLIELQDEKNYKKQVSKVKMARQSEKIQNMLKQEQKNWNKKTQ